MHRDSGNRPGVPRTKSGMLARCSISRPPHSGQAIASSATGTTPASGSPAVGAWVIDGQRTTGLVS